MKSLLIAIALVGCHKDEPLEREFIQLTTKFVNGAGGNAPLVVALHGKASDPERFSLVFEHYTGKVELGMARGPIADGAGYAWFDWPRGLPEVELDKRIDDAADRLWSAIAARAHGRPVYIVGFSQGATIAYALAAKHPEIAYAFPIAGWLPESEFPKAKPAPVYALHGTADDTVNIDWGRATVAAFKAAGGTAELHEYPNVPHRIFPEMRDDVFAHLDAALPR